MRDTRRKLEQTREEIVARLGGSSRVNTSSEAGDQADFAARAEQHELSMGEIHRLRVKLKLVTQAMGRVDEGTYGACTECGGIIAAARLTAIPWVETCIGCAEKLERLRD